MKRYFGLCAAVGVLLSLGAPPLAAQSGAGPTGPVRGAHFHTAFVKTAPRNGYGLLYLPDTPGPNARIAIVYAAPHALFDFSPASEMANRGYRVLLVKHYLQNRRELRESSIDGLQEASRGIAYMRAFPGVERVVLMGNDEGGRMAAFYAAAAEQGAAVCQNPALIYPCKAAQVSGLAKPDGVLLLDPALGAIERASAIDPAYSGKRRGNPALDMFAAANGYDAKARRGAYKPDFAKRFYAAQSARNRDLIDQANARLKQVIAGQTPYSDDDPLVVPGAIDSGVPAHLYDTDLSLLSHTKAAHVLIGANGASNAVIRSLRPAAGPVRIGALADCCAKITYTVRRFLDNDAIHTNAGFAITADDIVGVDWKSSGTSTPANAEAITVPALVLTMSCTYHVVPGEIVFDHLAAKDKTYAAVEGAGANFAPCKPQYGDTAKRAFDYVDGWLGSRGRF